MKDICGEYKIKIYQDKEDPDWTDDYLAEIECPDGYKGMTSGENEEDICDMISDWIMCVYDIEQKKWYKQPLWWWNRLKRMLNK